MVPSLQQTRLLDALQRLHKLQALVRRGFVVVLAQDGHLQKGSFHEALTFKKECSDFYFRERLNASDTSPWAIEKRFSLAGI